MNTHTALLAGISVLTGLSLCRGELGDPVGNPGPSSLGGTVGNAPPGTRVVVRRRGVVREEADVPVSPGTGRYEARGLPPGQYDLVVLSPDGRAWCGLDPALAPGDLSPVARRATESLFRRYEDWMNVKRGLEGVLSRSFVDARGKDYPTLVREDANAMRVVESRRAQQPKGVPGDRYEWEVTVESVTPEAGGGVVVLMRQAQMRTVLATDERQTASRSWGLFRAREQSGVWLLLGASLLVDSIHNVKSLVVIPAAKLAGIKLGPGERSDGHDLDLPEAASR